MLVVEIRKMGLILNIRIKLYRWQSRNLTNCGNDVAVYIYTCMTKESDDILTREKNSKKGQTNSICKIEIEIK
jgi:hypothetical protein